jgi:hypothetical protein
LGFSQRAVVDADVVYLADPWIGMVLNVHSNKKRLFRRLPILSLT